LGKKVRFWTGASVADNADYVMLHKEGKKAFFNDDENFDLG
jgi:hypothetical protein